MITKEITTEFQEAIKEEYGRDISFQEASRILNDLVVYFDLLAKIDHRMANGP